MDYWFMGAGPTEKEQEEAEKAGQTPVLVLHDSESKGIFSTVVPRKGPGPRVIRHILNVMAGLGYRRAVLKRT